MYEFIKLYESKGLSRTELLKELENEYFKSKKTREKLLKKFNKFILEINYNAGFDAGFETIFSMRNATQKLEDYIEDRRDNTERRRNDKTVWTFALENAKDGFKMESSYFKYKALKQVLDGELDKLSYTYRD